MTRRREKAKPQPQLNRQLEQSAAPQQPRKQGRWKENLGKYLLDVSKYVLTGVVITSLFGSVDDYFVIYALGTLTVLITLLVGLILTNNKVEE